MGRDYLDNKIKTKLNVINAEEVWDFDSGDYSGTNKTLKKKEKTTKPQKVSNKDEKDQQKKIIHDPNQKNENKGDVDDIFDDLGEEEF